MVEQLRLDLDRDILRKNFLKYTRKAFHLIPKIDQPLILDVGCGSGIQTLELASLSHGNIIAIDIDDLQLNILRKRIAAKRLNNRIQVMKCSFHEMEFSEELFDIIWGEGVGGFINFEAGLKTWKRFIKPKGFLVLHESSRVLTKNLKVVSKHGYTTISHFLLPDNAWWEEYYQPFENQVKELLKKHQNTPHLIKALKKHQKEVENFKQNPESSGFIIIQKSK